ncbi:hypothetical protein RF11_05609 [Thelohanellus kitauei]|uniref:Uncharacterized protein n=1 Tax=Thelohanellus kitauei TaxID=669202 RepID=A0A0C2M0J4_THEKT|nr:hypothetical protein RF11_05609 [Thelohanellus kitauei]
MGVKIMLENFEILKGYSDHSGKRLCMDDDRENFTKCPISVNVYVGSMDPIRMLDLNSEISEKKLDYSTVITREYIDENEEDYELSIYSIYIAAYINNDKDTDVKTFHVIDILTYDKIFGMFSQKCNGCMGMMGIVRYWGFLKYSDFLYRFHIMDIDFDPFRFVLLKINLIDIRTSSKDNTIIDDHMTPRNIFGGFNSDKYFGLIDEFCYGWTRPISVWLPKYMKFSNYTIRITCKEYEHHKFVMFFNK